MYQILCDGFALYDPRDNELIVSKKKCKIGSNICGEASFDILANHPHYDKLKKLKSVFEIRQDDETIFRGRMTDDSRDFDNMKSVDLEGALAYLNDSSIRPFSFPGDFPEVLQAENVVEFFFTWLIEQHNSQVESFQRFKVGKVTVTDPNNYLARSSTEYAKTWTIVKDRLFGSSLGGYLCIRYEPDGNYLDYLADYVDENGNKLVNNQVVEYGTNLLDFKNESDGKQTYSAVIPLGKKVSGSEPLTISSLPDGNVTDDIVKEGDTLYSRKAVAEYGWICAPTSETTFSDVTKAANLQNSGVSFLKSKSAGFLETITLTATDLHLTDSEIEAFRVYKYVAASSAPHDSSGIYPLSELNIDMDNLQNTKIKIGETKSALTDRTNNTAQKVEKIEKDYATQENLDYIVTDVNASISQAEDNIRLEVKAQIQYIDDTTAELSSEILQLSDKISLVVSSTGSDNTINSASIIAAINDDTSTISINANKIDLTAYAKSSEVYDTAFEAGRDAAAESVGGITLSVSNGATSSRLALVHDGLAIDSATIRFTGVVTFDSLEAEGETVINGSNITTGEISADRIGANNGVYIKFNHPFTTESIGELEVLYFGEYASIYKEDYDTTTTSALCFESLGGYKFIRYAPVVERYVNGQWREYEIIDAYNISDYI